MNGVKDILERSAFGVCNYLGDKMGIASSRVRLYFIYITFVALGSPILIYLAAAFWLNIRRYLKQSRSFLWD
ncbi:MAG: PspC family transcriptional regulator [Saprospiraceae bacterium]|jgi:phage shock protein PspC (stress-responsive transcriptional regulator)|nr:PspC family transcriptional regulator [Saprospiraceae bacterium]NUQ25635.1 PspC family transcriptional regulator [Saprospiraceae bacterium]